MSLAEGTTKGQVFPDRIYSATKNPFITDDEPSRQEDARSQNVEQRLQNLLCGLVSSRQTRDSGLMAALPDTDASMSLDREHERYWKKAGDELRSIVVYFTNDEVPPDTEHISDFQVESQSLIDLAGSMGSLVEDENLHISRIRLEKLEHTVGFGGSGTDITDRHLKESNTHGPSTLLSFNLTGARPGTAGRSVRHAAFEGFGDIRDIKTLRPIEERPR